MSLRLRLSLLITILFLLILAGGSFYVINNARIAIYEEVNSTASLTLQLIEIGLINASTQTQLEEQNRILEALSNMEGTRHLHIQYFRSVNADRKIPVTADFAITADAPAWFIKLVKPPSIEFRRVIAGEHVPYTEIIIKANPSDEITEVWRETKSVLLLLLLFAIFANIVVYIYLGRGLSPIESILKGLTGIEQGDYKLRLPKFNTPELSRISEKFNHMAGVLQRSRDENKLLAQHSLAIQEDERRHLAHELHDELGQNITAIKAVAVSIEKQSGKLSGTVMQQARTILEYSNHMYEVARRMMHRLRPAILDEFGLIKALQHLIDDWNDHQDKCFCSFNFTGSFDKVPEEIMINIYRIVQESLTNITKHAGASEVSIKIESTDTVNKDDNNLQSGILLTISDNGCGFDNSTLKKGLGLIGMQERVEAYNGTFQIASYPGQGTIITIKLPEQPNDL